MKSIKNIYKIGNGPSSSHTVGPYNAALIFKNRYPDADSFEVTLYGSLAYTGEGHGTTKAILSVIPDCVVLSDKDEKDLPHPNTMLFRAYKINELIGENRIFSIGGGSISIEGEISDDEKEIYSEKNFTEIIEECKKNNISLVDFIYMKEGEQLKDYLKEVWDAMKASVERGLNTEGILPGGLNVSRKAKGLYETRCITKAPIPQRPEPFLHMPMQLVRRMQARILWLLLLPVVQQV